MGKPDSNDFVVYEVPPARDTRISRSPPPRKQSRLPLILGLLLIPASSALVFFVMSGSSPSSPAKATDQAKTADQGPTQKVVPNKKDEAVVAAVGETGSADPQPTLKTFDVALKVSPSEAWITIDGTRMGQGQYQGSFPRDGKAHTLRVEASGRESFETTFVDAPPAKTISLSPSDSENKRQQVNNKRPGLSNAATRRRNHANSNGPDRPTDPQITGDVSEVNEPEVKESEVKGPEPEDKKSTVDRPGKGKPAKKPASFGDDGLTDNLDPWNR